MCRVLQCFSVLQRVVSISRSTLWREGGSGERVDLERGWIWSVWGYLFRASYLVLRSIHEESQILIAVQDCTSSQNLKCTSKTVIVLDSSLLPSCNTSWMSLKACLVKESCKLPMMWFLRSTFTLLKNLSFPYGRKLTRFSWSTHFP